MTHQQPTTLVPCVVGTALGNLLLLMLLFCGTTAGAQLYATKEGVITVKGSYQGTAVVATSHQLHVQLHYNTSKIHLHLSPGTLQTSNDSLRALLLHAEAQDIFFAGALKTGPLSTRPHARQMVQIPGTLTLHGISRPYTLNAALEHLSDGNTRCLLSGALTIHLADFGLATAPQENQVQVSFQQLILKSPGEQ